MNFPSYSLDLLRDRYFLPEETLQQFFIRVAKSFSSDDAHYKRYLSYLKNKWVLPATPILSNGGTSRGMPVSCFLNYVDDSRSGLAEHYTESLWMSTCGGGIGGYWGALRSLGESTSSGNKTTGVMPFLHVVDSLILAANQGSTRRGSYAAYLDISHPEILEFMNMRTPSGGDIHRKNLNLHHGVNITDTFMQAVLDDADFNLVDPHSKTIKRVIRARDLWQRILEVRMLTGEPYIHFIDRSNEFLNPELKSQGFKVNHSNLCTEILLPTSKGYSNVCILSSLNLEEWDSWKDNNLFIKDVLEYLDNVTEYFISNAPISIDNAVRASRSERSVGIGTMGFHSLLQSKNIPFESALAESLNRQIFEYIKTSLDQADEELKNSRGTAELLEKTRFAHKIAIAPNSNISVIMGTSPSIEPWASNYFIQKTKSGSFVIKNRYLDKLLRTKYNSNEVSNVWKSIRDNQGSVQHLERLDDWEKSVFKTAGELDQYWVVHHASVRQPYIDQGQSVNLFFPSNADIKYYNQAHIKAWKQGLKTLYYVRSSAARVVDSLREAEEKECLSCV